MCELSPECIEKIEAIVNDGKTAEIAIRGGKLVVWSVSSKKKYEMPVT